MSATGLARGWRQLGTSVPYAVRCKFGPPETLGGIGTILLGITVLSSGDFARSSEPPNFLSVQSSSVHLFTLETQGRKGLSKGLLGHCSASVCRECSQYIPREERYLWGLGTSDSSPRTRTLNIGPFLALGGVDVLARTI